MFKKLKDKLAEEVKSSPQRIQQIAQAAQAAVTSASSSISDITNSDLFSIGDNDNQQLRTVKTHLTANIQPENFQDVLLVQPDTSHETMDYPTSHDTVENQKLRRLSNSSLASDVSFRLPSYETPSMYHLQSDMEVSASEAEERSLSSGFVSLDRVTKEQLYTAYRRTQDRYKKYRTQYGDLARHYKLLERENAKARSVLVETQDKALRRISELKEQCSLEQSAKAHLEKALRVEIDEKNMKINALNTNIDLLQVNTPITNVAYMDSSNLVNQYENINKAMNENQNKIQLINLSSDDEINQSKNESADIATLSNKIEKMEKLINKYKESLKACKDKSSQMTAELQILTCELENKSKENQQLNETIEHFSKTKLKVQELNDINEELQNKINSYDFAKSKEMSALEIDLQKAQENISQLQSKIDIFVKREEEYAISLAENKLSIHKELEGKETEIKSLKSNLSAVKKEIQSLNIVITDYKNNITLLEEENKKYINDRTELTLTKNNLIEMETQIQNLTKKCNCLEQSKTKADEESKCYQLQMKQETAEKLAMIDRNVYLENRNAQLTEENTKKSAQLSILDSELKQIKNKMDTDSTHISGNQEKKQLTEELNMWKSRFEKLESEIQEERVELVKLQSEIEKLLENHELIQKQNTEYNVILSTLKSENKLLRDQVVNYNKVKCVCKKLTNKFIELKSILQFTSEETKLFREANKNMVNTIMENVNISLNQFIQHEIETSSNKFKELEVKYFVLQTNMDKSNEQLAANSKEFNSLQEQNNDLNETIKIKESENKELYEKLSDIQSKYDISVKEINALKNQQNMLIKVQECEQKYQELQTTTDVVANNIKSLENYEENLVESIKHLENNKSSLNAELYELQEKHKKYIMDLNSLQKKNDDLLKNHNDFDKNVIYVHKLEDSISVLTQENISLKEQAEMISQNVRILEFEINEVRKSHAEMELEKDRLTEIIQKLENEKSWIKSDENCQTDLLADDILVENEIQVKKGVINDSGQQCKAFINNQEITENYDLLKTEYDIIKDENKRLQSDIEGLQSYLTKISKENSVLNDKLRESIATTENSSETVDLKELKKEVLIGKEKIDDLLRENTLLIEENFELKDQIHLQNYTLSNEGNSQNDIGIESSASNLKIKSLLHTNVTLEKRLHDLEQMNRSVNGNMQEIYDKNEKLKLSNEKLERRLDEALVSLRHLHALQENTELEYLRNILYEYLTGSGSHSVTLVRVLSAVVKFDDMQTQLVLQKEKERQGFLRQLGII